MHRVAQPKQTAVCADTSFFIFLFWVAVIFQVINNMFFSSYQNRNQQPFSTPSHIETSTKNVFSVRLLLQCLLSNLAQPRGGCGLCTLSWCSCTGVITCFPKGKFLAWELAFRFWGFPPVQHHGWVSGLRVPGLVAPCRGPMGHLAFSLWALRHIVAGPQNPGYCCATDVHPAAPCIVEVEHPGTSNRISGHSRWVPLNLGDKSS